MAVTLNELTVIHTNDTEAGTFEQWPRITTAVRNLRNAGQCDLLVHVGDITLGYPSGWARVAAMNNLGFDAVTIGNHELDHGLDPLCEQLGELRAQALCANVTGLPPAHFQPYCLLNRQGFRIGLVGVTLPEMSLYQPRRHLAGLSFHSPEDALRPLIPALRAQADIVIVLSHCGYESDLGLATQVEGIDLIVGGHSHHQLSEPVCVGATRVVQAGQYGEYVGRVTITDGRGGRDLYGGLVSTQGLSPAQDIAGLTPVDEGDEIVGFATVDLDRSVRAGETPLGNLTADLMRAAARADLAFLRCASADISFPAGPIRRRDISTLNHCGMDHVVRLELTGAEVREVLECGAREAYYLLTTSGARVVYDADCPVGERVVSAEVAGRPLEADKTYIVACSEILALGGAGFTPFRGKTFEVLPHTVTGLLNAHIWGQGSIHPQRDGRLKVLGSLPIRPVS